MRKRKKKSPVVRKDTSQKARKKAVIKKRVDKSPKEGIYNGVPYESLTEKYCLAWMFELKNQGYISFIGRSPSFLLADAVTNTYAVTLKKGSKAVEQTLLRPHTYTADFVCTFTPKALGIFCWDIASSVKWEKHQLISHKDEGGQYLCYLEVKPDFSFQNKNQMAQNAMKWVYARYKLFVNMFKPDDRFSQTFTPKEYLKTGTGAIRNIKYEPRNLEEFLNLTK